jgi:hypothetical protein
MSKNQSNPIPAPRRRRAELVGLIFVIALYFAFAGGVLADRLVG